jgi:hypothetical protein
LGGGEKERGREGWKDRGRERERREGGEREGEIKRVCV